MNKKLSEAINDVFDDLLALDKESFDILMARISAQRAEKECTEEGTPSPCMLWVKGLIASEARRIADPACKPFLVRWKTRKKDFFTFPAWEEDKEDTEREWRYFQAAVLAVDEEDAEMFVSTASGKKIAVTDIQEKPNDWSPFRDRFEREEWMLWRDAGTPPLK